MAHVSNSFFDRVTSPKGAALLVPAILLVGAALAVGRQPAPDTAAPTAASNQAAPASVAASGQATSASGAPFSREQRSAIEGLVKDYLLKNPELMIEIQNALEAKMESLQADKLKVALKDNAADIFRRPNAPVAGNPSGDVTLVEFFDYNCGYCKRAFSDIAKAIETDPKLKVVLKELPILSKESEDAARVALAARAQGKYWDVHRALITLRGEVNEQAALRAAEKAGVDLARLKQDMASPEVAAEIAHVRELAQKMGIQGTPHFLVGDRPIAGAPQNLQELITSHAAEVRKTGCKVC